MSMRIAYADPPYLGTAAKFYGPLHPEAAAYDDPATHQLLVNRLSSEFPDGWALSLGSTSLRVILPMCPADVRVAAWTKPFASYKKGVNPGYAWEPVIFRGGRRRTDGSEPTVADYCAVGITLKRGFTGAKPERFVWWVLALLGAQADDEFVDLFPGSGALRPRSGCQRDQRISHADSHHYVDRRGPVRSAEGESGSGGRIRTYDQVINSHPL